MLYSLCTHSREEGGCHTSTNNLLSQSVRAPHPQAGPSGCAVVAIHRLYSLYMALSFYKYSSTFLSLSQHDGPNLHHILLPYILALKLVISLRKPASLRKEWNLKTYTGALSSSTEALSAKPEDWGSIPRPTWWEKKTVSCKLSSDLHTDAEHVCPCKKKSINLKIC